ncbi:hypothetical protein BDN72DRAFT_906409 [Pluteus cervinus]|uniref:Uncharacterized protein n=1 Tax=Pluteus cervinus TaxID=181527 RepID=A0ACD2ZZB2_9AGAR|nr:hypothetical protein BDN72DRAFT_906409 [Pluteus cervinus]
MDANGSATTNISQCTIYNTIHHYSSVSQTKITSTTTASEEATDDNIPCINSTDGQTERVIHDWLASASISHHEVASDLSFDNAAKILYKDLYSQRRSAIWQRSENISQMQMPSENLSSLAVLLAAPHSKQMIPALNWQLLQGEPICYREQMVLYTKRNPVFLASLFLKRSSSDWNLNHMLSWLSEMIINVRKLCMRPMVLFTINIETSWTGSDFKLQVLRIVQNRRFNNRNWTCHKDSSISSVT